MRHDLPTGGVINAFLPRRRAAKPLRKVRTPRVVELLRKAIEWRRQLDSGKVRNQAVIARREGITRARVTQVMGLLRLVPETRERILAMSEVAHRPTITERMLRPITSIANHSDQLRDFQEYMDKRFGSIFSVSPTVVSIATRRLPRAAENRWLLLLGKLLMQVHTTDVERRFHA